MSIEKIIFYVFAASLIFAASGVVLVKNPVKAALCLVGAFFSAAGLWLMLEAPFLAVTLVLIYVGAVMVLFLFIVMMLDIEMKPLKETFWQYFPLGFLIGVLLILGLYMGLSSDKFGVILPGRSSLEAAQYSDVKLIGTLLYSDYLYPFEIAGIILLTAIVAAISLTFRGQRHRKMIDADSQVSVKKQDRIRLVHLHSHQENR
jgi:NADH-quinone oxidoreductase subunit J